MINLTIPNVLKLGADKMMGHDVPEQEATIAAPIFLEGDLWGKRTHGFRYLENCLLQYQDGATRRQELTIEYTTENSALVDGGFHFASFVHYTAMQVAIELAKTRGVAVVGARNSGFSGLLGYYSQMATEMGLIGIAVDSALAAVVAPGKSPLCSAPIRSPSAFPAWIIRRSSWTWRRAQARIAR
jgi:ureidoglycolate dehydrogenase (NAD+)